MPRSNLNMPFVDRVVDLLQLNPNGLTKDDFLLQYYGGNLPNQQTCDLTWEEFKNAERVSNALFGARCEGYCWIRARRGVRNTFYYHALAKIENGEEKILIPELFALQLHDQHTSEWETRTKTKMRSTVSAAEAMRQRGLATNNDNVIREAEARLDDVVMISTRLASINYGDGFVLDDLEYLAASPRLWLLHPQIKRTLQEMKRARKAINELARTVVGLKQIAQPDVRKELSR